MNAPHRTSPHCHAPLAGHAAADATTTRRQWLAAGAAGALAAALPSAFAQQAFPNKTVRIVVPYAPGGGIDVIARMLAEQQVEADRVVESLNAALAADGDALLNAAERAEIDAAIAHLLTMRNAGSTNQIKEAIEAADAVSGEFAARRMDASSRKVLTGQNVNKV